MEDSLTSGACFGNLCGKNPRDYELKMVQVIVALKIREVWRVSYQSSYGKKA